MYQEFRLNLERKTTDVQNSDTHGKALFTRDILAHNIAIKRYCNKNIFLSHGSQWLTKVSS